MNNKNMKIQELIQNLLTDDKPDFVSLRYKFYDIFVELPYSVEVAHFLTDIGFSYISNHGGISEFLDYLWSHNHGKNEFHIPMYISKIIEISAYMGYLNPTEADELGLKYFNKKYSQTAPLKLSDPLNEDYWTLAMLLVYVLTRDYHSARQCMHRYRKHLIYWNTAYHDHLNPHTSVYDCYEGYICQPANVEVGINDINDILLQHSKDFEILDLSEAKQILVPKLLNAEITALGKYMLDGTRRPIPAIEWLDFDIAFSRDLDSNLDTAGTCLIKTKNNIPQIIYSDVQISKNEVLQFWGNGEDRLAPHLHKLTSKEMDVWHFVLERYDGLWPDKLAYADFLREYEDWALVNGRTSSSRINGPISSFRRSFFFDLKNIHKKYGLVSK